MISRKPQYVKKLHFLSISIYRGSTVLWTYRFLCSPLLIVLGWLLSRPSSGTKGKRNRLWIRRMKSVSVAWVPLHSKCTRELYSQSLTDKSVGIKCVGKFIFWTLSPIAWRVINDKKWRGLLTIFAKWNSDARQTGRVQPKPFLRGGSIGSGPPFINSITRAFCLFYLLYLLIKKKLLSIKITIHIFCTPSAK